MKPVRKGGKRQERRERTLARLEKYLAGGVRTIKPGYRVDGNLIP